MANAIAYIVVDDRDLCRQFAQSARSLRTHGWDGPIVVLTNLSPDDRAWPRDTGHRCVPVADPAKSFGEKPRLYRRLAPFGFDRVFYLDTDTRAIAPVDGVFRLRNDPHVAFRLSIDKTLGRKAAKFRVPDMGHYDRMHQQAEVDATLAEVPATVPFYHAGTFVYRYGLQAAALFAAWEDEMERWGTDGADEWALVRAAHRVDPPDELPWAYNAFPLARRDLAHCLRMRDVVLHFYGPRAKPLLFSPRAFR